MYNFKTAWGATEEHAGLSAFALENGIVYHTYSCYARGLARTRYTSADTETTR